MSALVSLTLLADRKHRCVTRSQVRQIQSTFPLLKLPPELRNLIYFYCIDFESIKAYFDKSCNELLVDPRIEPDLPRKRTRTVFLLNKQVFQEAVYLLRKEQVVFHHGLLKIQQVSDIVSPNVLRQVSSIEVSDVGHLMIKSKILSESWYGYMRLLAQVADILADGQHNLKEFIVNFSDRRLEEHMTICFEEDYQCGFRDGMRNAINSLRKIHGVGKVLINGINIKLGKEVKVCMESKPKSLLALPREVRNMIYKEALDWSDISVALDRAVAKWPNSRLPFPYPTRTTPNVLLINKQVTAEALEVLHAKSLSITLPAIHTVEQEKQVPKVLRIISRRTLKQVNALYITMESWQWIYSICRGFVAALSVSKKLEILHIIIKDRLKQPFLNLQGQVYRDTQLHAKLKQLAKIRGLKEVCFEGGDLPISYTDPLMRIMTSRQSAAEQLPKMRAITKDGDIVNIGDDEMETTTEGQVFNP